MSTEIRRLKRSVRIVQHGCVLSDTPRRPGPTHSVFDVLAAAVAAFAPPGRVAMLGFAGGGMMAPLRMAGAGHPVHAVDLSADGHRLYRTVAKSWGGAVAFDEEDAVRWLRRQRGKFAAIVEDLSVPQAGDVVKPGVSWIQLPPIMERKLHPAGVAVANLLPTPGITWDEMIAAARIDRLPAVVVGLDRYYNRILVQGRPVASARQVGSQLRSSLRGIGSRLAGEISVRGL